MAKGIVRRIDELGRITLPKEYRDTYGVKTGDPLGILVEGNVIHLINPGPKFIGTVRGLDELGRYTLPIEIRRSLGFNDRQEVDIFDDQMNDAISIRKYGKECVGCGSENDLLDIDGLIICRACANKVLNRLSTNTQPLL